MIFKNREDLKLPKMEECIERRLYKIKCRNLTHGVWNGKDGFIGIRTKFNQKYLFTELHWDTGEPYGTVREAIDTGIDVPDGIELKECSPTVDEFTQRLVGFDKPIADGGKGWFFLDTGEASQDILSMIGIYKPLFDWMIDFANQHP